MYQRSETQPCDTSGYKVNGIVSDGTFNGSISAEQTSASFSMTGTSNLMSGDFTLTYLSGICRGAYNGTVTMTVI